MSVPHPPLQVPAHGVPSSDDGLGPGPDLCGCPPTPGPPGDARGRAGAHGQVSPMRRAAYPAGSVKVPAASTQARPLGTRSPQLPRRGRGRPAEARGLRGIGQKKSAPSLYLQQVVVARGKVVGEGVTTRRPPQRRPTSATSRTPAKAGRTRPESRREPRSQAPAAGRSAPAPRPSPPPDSARACALLAPGGARV